MLAMTRRAWLMLAWGILILTIVDGTNFFNIPPYSANENSQTNSEANYEQEGFDGPVFSVLIKIFDSIEGFVDRHETLLIVLSTIAIAAFTYTLWRATTGLFSMAKSQANDMQTSLAIAKQSADAATKSAVALAAAERPYIFVQVHKKGDINIAVPKKEGIFPVSSSYEILTRNAGRTPAILAKVQKTVAPLPTVPTNLDGVHETPIPEGGMVISAGQFQEFTDVFWITAEQYALIQSGSLSLYGYGLITYADILNPGMTLETGFCWKYEPINNTWYLIPSNLNRRT